MRSSIAARNFRSIPTYGVVGGSVIVLAELGLLLKIKIIGIYFTPIVWTGYIFLLDGLQWSLQGSSLIRSRSKEFVWMLPWSVFCWLIFEGFNLYLQNWKYVGLPSNTFAQAVGYVWSFATIFPAVLVTADLFESKLSPLRVWLSFRLSRSLLIVLTVSGGIMLLLPLMVSQEIASKLFGLVWIGFIFLLDPINYACQRNSIISPLSQGDIGKIMSLFLSGLWCGFLWEFWNYWAAARWMYNVPLSIAGPKLFEMPLLGYLGFLPFAIECYVMNEFFFVLFPNLVRHGS